MTSFVIIICVSLLFLAIEWVSLGLWVDAFNAILDGSLAGIAGLLFMSAVIVALNYFIGYKVLWLYMIAPYFYGGR